MNLKLLINILHNSISKASLLHFQFHWKESEYPNSVVRVHGSLKLLGHLVMDNIAYCNYFHLQSRHLPLQA